MSYFVKQTINFGTVNKNSSKEIVFKALPTIPTIIDLIASCGCLKMKWYPESREIKVIYKAGEIPKQVLGNQNVRKTVTVVYKDRTSEVLELIGIKLR